MASVQKQQPQLNSATTLTNGTGTKSIEENLNGIWSSSHPTTNGIEQLTNGRWKLDLLSSNDIGNSNVFVKTNGNVKPINGFALNGNKPKDSNNSSSSIARPIQNGFHLPPPGSKQHQQNGQNTNLFTPDSEFVADFSSANIFDALNQKPSINHNNNNTNNNNTISTNKLNGVKHALNGIEMSNGNGNQLQNGNCNTNGNNSFNDVNKIVDENFADFEHNTIYNAAGELNR